MHKWDAERYSKTPSDTQKWGMELVSRLHLEGWERVLDIGCGDGKLTAEIAKRVPRGEASGSRRRAFLYSFLAGIAQPVGALLGYAILFAFLTPTVVSALLAFAAGIMVYISLDELLPAAHKYGEAHLTIVGIAIGMAVMAVTLVLLG